MASDLRHYKELLLRKQQELLDEISRRQKDALESNPAEVDDPGDLSVADVGKDTAFEEGTAEWETLQQVRDALQRIDNDAYGKCIDCGREIPRERLEAVPWSPYCVTHQAKHDSETASRTSSI
ncbi:MAG TPA: TraR/DksA C4-type zinc finger protein [Bryobacteraceae bacterium]|nr:TraR/DksA C4-type zinc finger protein [Bryobacteraceae bacterium]